MNLYQKVATLVLRLVSTLIILYGAAYFKTFVLRRLIFDETPLYLGFSDATEKRFLVNGFQYIVIGVVMFLLSNTIGKVLARGLDD